MVAPVSTSTAPQSASSSGAASSGASVGAGRSAVTQNAIDSASEIGTETSTSGGAYMDLLNQSTAQTIAIQTALLNHNLTVGPIMAAKSASEDAKKT